mmetsp:Transcript_6804/g.22779  ORF Transcript_6804/g.22779 Transcript_6804/m.22779 type:complete len:399 (-) Transcript_6804:226-1422(-)
MATHNKPITVVFVKPNNFCTGAKSVALTVKETTDKVVSNAPICVGDISSFFDNKSGKKESNVDCPALYRKLVKQIVATAGKYSRPSGQLRASGSYTPGAGFAGFVALAPASSLASAFAASKVSAILWRIIAGDVINTATSAAAAIDAHPVTLIAADRLYPANNNPPNVGPTINANVHDASRHAMSCGKNSGVAASAKYAFTTGLAPANAPLSTRKSKNVCNDHPDFTHSPCKINPTPTPMRLNTNIGFLPTLSLNRGQRNSAPNIPSGYALVKYPTFSAAREKCDTNPGVIGPVTVNPSKCKNTASMTQNTDSFCLSSTFVSSEPSYVLAPIDRTTTPRLCASLAVDFIVDWRDVPELASASSPRRPLVIPCRSRAPSFPRTLARVTTPMRTVDARLA